MPETVLSADNFLPPAHDGGVVIAVFFAAMSVVPCSKKPETVRPLLSVMLVPPLAGRCVKHLVDVPLDCQQFIG